MSKNLKTYLCIYHRKLETQTDTQLHRPLVLPLEFVFHQAYTNVQ